MGELDKKRVISRTLEGVRRGVEETEFEPVEGVTADAVDAAEARALLLRLARMGKKAFQANKPPASISKVKEAFQAAKLPTSIPKTKAPKLSRVLGPLARKLPPVEAAALMYETMALINSEEAQEKAKEQANVMQERGYSAEGMSKNALQGLLDPAGTIYAAGDAFVDLTKTSVGNLVDKYLGP